MKSWKKIKRQKTQKWIQRHFDAFIFQNIQLHYQPTSWIIECWLLHSQISNDGEKAWIRLWYTWKGTPSWLESYLAIQLYFMVPRYRQLLNRVWCTNSQQYREMDIHSVHKIFTSLLSAVIYNLFLISWDVQKCRTISVTYIQFLQKFWQLYGSG